MKISVLLGGKPGAAAPATSAAPTAAVPLTQRLPFSEEEIRAWMQESGDRIGVLLNERTPDDLEILHLEALRASYLDRLLTLSTREAAATAPILCAGPPRLIQHHQDGSTTTLYGLSGGAR